MPGPWQSSLVDACPPEVVAALIYQTRVECEQATKSSDADVKALAEKILPTLQKHLQVAQELKK